jgi:ferredoxin-NADP reductase
LKAPRIPVVVAEIEEITPLVKRFKLVPKSGEPLPTFAGGAHIAVEMQDGDIVRRNSYSLMSSPFDTSHYAISVRRDDAGRGGSLFLHQKVAEGQELFIGHPVNLFPMDRRARRHLLVAGGIGITPFLSMIEHFAAEGADFALHYAARSAVQAAYAAMLQQRFPDRVTLYLLDKGEMLALRDLLPRQQIGTHLYVCGPAGLIDDAIAIAAELGWPEQAVHYEHFLAPPVGAPYEIRLAASDKHVHVGSHQSMLEAIEAAGVEAPYLCRGGACGQCETDVLACDGQLLHFDHFLSDEAKASGRKVMPCVSRFEGRLLTLDR